MILRATWACSAILAVGLASAAEAQDAPADEGAAEPPIVAEDGPQADQAPPEQAAPAPQEQAAPPATDTHPGREAAAAVEAEKADQPRHIGRWTDHGPLYERWENGLDAKVTNLFTRHATDVESPTLILSAQWNYRFKSDTYLGFAASGMPQSNADQASNGETRNFSLYYAGLNLGQGIFEDGPYKAIVTIMAGEGVVYVRYNTADPNGDFGKSMFTVIEPSVYLTFFDYAGLDIGAVASYRVVSLNQTDRAQNSDLSTPSIGLTFRTTSW